MGVRIADEYGAMKPIVAPVRAPAAAGAVGLIRAAPAPAGAAVAVNEDAAALAAEPPLEGGVEESEAAPWPSASEEAAFLSGAPEGVAAVLAMPLAETPPTEKLAPLPPLEARRRMRSLSSWRFCSRRASPEPSVLPSMTTQTGCQWRLASATVSSSFPPVL